MRRPITGYRQDERGDWIVELRCGHRQHVRHKPPFFLRPWITTEGGRASMLGTELDCMLCDRLELPDDFKAYKRTDEFEERSTPAGLLREHHTKQGVWGLLHVTQGRVRYVIDGMGGRTFDVLPGEPGVIPAEVLHHVEPDGAARFYVEFYRREPPSS
jgi:tellurite methyltransferase